MDGFRDRMNRGSSERGSYDRYDRGSRRQSFGGSQYGAPAQPSMNIDELAQIVEDSNEKQLQVIEDFFEDARDDRFQSEKEIIAALDSVKEDVKKACDLAAEAKAAAPEPQQTEPVVAEDSELTKEIYKTVTSNNDLLAQLAEEQVSMLIRGNSAILNQIRESLIENDETLKEILRNSDKPQAAAPSMVVSDANEELLNTATTNNALLNALRSDIAGIQSEIRSTNDRMSQNADDSNAPLDMEEADGITKAHADELARNLEEAVHSECVKVYRNIQKVLEDQNAAVADTVKRGVGGVKVISIINLVLIILNLAALIAKLLELIP